MRSCSTASEGPRNESCTVPACTRPRQGAEVWAFSVPALLDAGSSRGSGAVKRWGCGGTRGASDMPGSKRARSGTPAAADTLHAPRAWDFPDPPGGRLGPWTRDLVSEEQHVSPHHTRPEDLGRRHHPDQLRSGRAPPPPAGPTRSRGARPPTRPTENARLAPQPHPGLPATPPISARKLAYPSLTLSLPKDIWQSNSHFVDGFAL